MAFHPVSVRRNDIGTVGKNLDTWVSRIIDFSVFFQANRILTSGATHDIVSRADPTHPVAFKRAITCKVPWQSAPKADEQPPIRSVFAGMPISGQRKWDFARLAPCFAFVVGEDHVRILATSVLAEQDRHHAAVRRAQAAGFTQMDFRRLVNDLGKRPGQSTVGRKRLKKFERLRLRSVCSLRPMSHL